MIEPTTTPQTRLTTLRNWLLTRDPDRRLPWQPILEIGLIILWAMWLGRDYLELAPNMWPNGREFGMAIHPHYIWTQLKECGSCVLWNGFYNGGSPAFTELHAAVLHPLVIIATLIWGGLNGAKIVIVGSLAMAGIGQWWLAKVMRLGWVARLWSAAMVAAGGHLAGRMEIGVVGVIVSTAACSLIIAPGIQLARSDRRRDAIPLAVVLALAILSGQGYLQIGLLVSIIPAFAILMVDDQLRIRSVWREFVLTGVLALLLAGPFVIPFLHFWPQFGKDMDFDLVFPSVQSLEYIPLNFVIRNLDLYYTDQLGKLPYPYLYLNYIGWIPLLFALLPLRLAKSQERRLLTFFIVSIGLVFLASSAVTFRQIGQFLPDLVAGLRYPSLIAGLAVPLILGLAAWGIDRLWQLKWMILPFAPDNGLKYPKANARLSQFILLMVLILALRAAASFSRSWLFTDDQDEMMLAGIEAVQTESAQWVTLPLGEHFWAPAAAEAGLKLTQQARPSHWKERPAPPSYLEATRHSVSSAEIDSQLISTEADLILIKQPQNQYAFVTLDKNGEAEPCTAVATGGHITVNCTTSQPGLLIVQENRWSGWKAWQDGNPISIGNQSQWLTVNAPAGEHVYQFRYLPGDVLAGFITMLIGIVLAVVIWLKAPGN